MVPDIYLPIVDMYVDGLALVTLGLVVVSLLIGLLMGVTNFVGFYAFLAALAKGPLSIVVSITGMYFVMAVVLSALVYKERLDPPRIVAIVLALIAVLLLRM